MWIHKLHLCLITTTDGSVTDGFCVRWLTHHYFPTATANMHLPLACVACAHLFIFAHPLNAIHDHFNFVSFVTQYTVHTLKIISCTAFKKICLQYQS